MMGKFEGGGEGVDRGWDSWMASPTQWTWVWASSGSWWWTGRLGVLQSMGSQRVGHDEQLKTDNAICSMQKKKPPRYLTKDNILIANKHMKKYLTHAHQKSLKDIHSNFILKNGNSSSVYQRKKTKCSIFIQWNILYSKREWTTR